MAKIGIQSAMPVEIEGILPRFEAKELHTPHFYKVYEGHAGENTLYFACSGIGKVNAAACTQHLIDAYGVDCVINMGIAGGIDKSLHTLDVVLGDEVFYHDFHPAELFPKYFPFTGSFHADEKLLETACRVCAGIPQVQRCLVGHIASGDCFVEANETKDAIRALGGVCCEMEGAAIGHVCHINAVPFLIVRTISDLADGDAGMTYAEFEQKASVQANLVVEGMLRAL